MAEVRVPEVAVRRTPRAAGIGAGLLVCGGLLVASQWFDPFVRRFFDPESAGFLGLVCIAIAAMLGRSAWRSKLGKIVCLISYAILAWFLVGFILKLLAAQQVQQKLIDGMH